MNALLDMEQDYTIAEEGLMAIRGDKDKG